MNPLLTEYQNFNIDEGLAICDSETTWENVAFYASAIAFTVIAVGAVIATGLFEPVYIPIAMMAATSALGPFYESVIIPINEKIAEIARQRTIIEHVQTSSSSSRVDQFKNAWISSANNAQARATELFAKAKELPETERTPLRNRAHLIEEKEYLPCKIMAAAITCFQNNPHDHRSVLDIGSCDPKPFADRQWARLQESDDIYFKFRGEGGLTRDFLMTQSVPEIANALRAT